MIRRNTVNSVLSKQPRETLKSLVHKRNMEIYVNCEIKTSFQNKNAVILASFEKNNQRITTKSTIILKIIYIFYNKVQTQLSTTSVL